MKGLRIYEEFWKVTDDAANANAPERVTLLFDTANPRGPVPPSAPPAGGGNGATATADLREASDGDGH